HVRAARDGRKDARVFAPARRSADRKLARARSLRRVGGRPDRGAGRNRVRSSMESLGTAAFRQQFILQELFPESRAAPGCIGQSTARWLRPLSALRGAVGGGPLGRPRLVSGSTRGERRRGAG